MKRINNYVLNGALALLSTAGFVACSSSDDVTDAPVNPTYDGKSVKTQFAINIATPSNGKTRMSAENTQNNNNFLGMNSIKLFPFSSNPEKDVNWTKNISLTNINDGITSDNSSKIYSNVEIPVGTNNFLFYGFGPMGGTPEDKFKKGTLTTNFPSEVATAPSSISASLVPILETENEMSTIQRYYTTYLNGIKNVDGWSTTDDISLQNAYNLFITIGSTGVRCGSANAILKTVEKLYNLANKVKNAPTSTSDAKTVAEAIMTAIIPTSGDIIVKANPGTDNSYTLAYEQTEGNQLAEKYKFPVNLNLPEGAAQLTCDATHGFAYKDKPTIGATNSAINVYGLTYPSSIAYTANTKAKATAKKMEDNDWPKTVSAWDSSDQWPTTVPWTDAVQPTSNSVALVNNINYSVACLETTVKCKDSSTSLEDNRQAIVNDGTTPDQNIKIPNDGFKVTAVLVGGQPNKVDWQFIDNSSNRDAVIYDNALTDIFAKSGTESSKNYTLVFDNYKSGSQQDDVLMAIELENNSESDFYGFDGVIMKNQKFYLVAKLSMSDSNTISSWPTEAYRFPYNGTTRVFVQDYTTKVNLTIKDLKKAYSTIPDLRSVELQLGLSVDLTWQNGLTFDVSID